MKDDLYILVVPSFMKLNVKAMDMSNIMKKIFVQLCVSFVVMAWTQENKIIFLWWKISLVLLLATMENLDGFLESN